MPIARKDCKCTLCGKTIAKGEDYFYQRIKPWDHPDNECFSTFRAHRSCYSVWGKVGHEWDWYFPSPSEFNECVGNIYQNPELCPPETLAAV